MEGEKDITERAEEYYQDSKEKQREAIFEIGQAEGLGNSETVSLGEEQITVKGWLPGDISEEFRIVMKAVKEQDEDKVLKNMDLVTEILANICLDEPYNQSWFWSEFYDQWGFIGLFKALDKLGDPAAEHMKSQGDVDNMEEKKQALGNSHKQAKGWQRQ